MANRVYALSLRATVGWLIAIIVLFGGVMGYQQQNLRDSTDELHNLIADERQEDGVEIAIRCKDSWDRQIEARKAWVEMGGKVSAASAVAVGRVSLRVSLGGANPPADLLEQLRREADLEGQRVAEASLDANYPEPECDLAAAEKILAGQ